MADLFGLYWDGPPFVFFSPPHWFALACVAVACGWVMGPARSLSAAARRYWRYALAAILAINEFAYNLWFWVHGLWSIQYMLPLHLCTLFTWFSVIMLLTRSYRIFEFTYFMGIGGALQALLTPDIGVYGFPHFRAFQSFISHGGLVLAALTMIALEGYRPTWRSVGRVIIGANLLMAGVGVVNWLLDSNYLFLARKPYTPSLLDVLGPWPIYIVWMEVIGIVTILLLYLPFAVADLRQRSPMMASRVRR
ncbi:TIGR02206 family membrane protein [Chloroflexus sp.]|uniref:YwaF family protein n=1 Tax=Chloroflexus sp. TaxID=1904827 RepID=UPI002ACDC271|nr:TIGR02206 family membrane protein [Chloroflexus sp.]